MKTPAKRPQKTTRKVKPKSSARRSPPGAATAKSKPKPKAKAGTTGPSASAMIDRRIQELADWRGETLAKMRALILDAAPSAVEEVKWGGTPVWSDHGILCTGESYKAVVKLTFARGASLPDPARLFNSSLEGNTRRALDLREGDSINTRAFKALVKAAVALNRARDR